MSSSTRVAGAPGHGVITRASRMVISGSSLRDIVAKLKDPTVSITATNARTIGRCVSAKRGRFMVYKLWVSNSLSGCRWQLNQVPAVRYPPYVVEVRTGYRGLGLMWTPKIRGPARVAA